MLLLLFKEKFTIHGQHFTSSRASRVQDEALHVFSSNIWTYLAPLGVAN